MDGRVVAPVVRARPRHLLLTDFTPEHSVTDFPTSLKMLSPVLTKDKSTGSQKCGGRSSPDNLGLTGVEEACGVAISHTGSTAVRNSPPTSCSGGLDTIVVGRVGPPNRLVLRSDSDLLDH
jgi:hypothetical protein